MINISNKADEQLFRDLAPHLAEWLQVAYDEYKANAVFPSKGNKSGSQAVRTAVLKDYMLSNEEDYIGPATLDRAGALSSPNCSIRLCTRGTKIVLRSDRSFDFDLKQPRPKTKTVEGDQLAIDFFRNLAAVPTNHQISSQFAVITWNYSESAIEEDQIEVNWHLKMYFSKVGESVSSADFKYGLEASVTAGSEVRNIKAFVPLDEELRFIAGDDAKELENS
ncbi:hypothetical protein [Corynebacterium cystitidis]|uniref:hypothetical protein n=1 Tax=Corynebacterium cystitidis TaxID=35757 RepID=UPI00211F4004|nr:hypothetical protein [Corynebacterium cystitidis]